MTTKEKRLAEISRHESKVGHIAVALSVLLLLLSSLSFTMLYSRSVSDGASINGLKTGFDNTRALLDQLCDKGANTASAQCKQAANQPATAAVVAKDGRPGTDGRDGLPGVDGKQGIQGLTGATGLQGLMGISTVGATGATGADSTVPGADGTNGTDGLPGTNGSDGRGITSVSCGSDGLWTIQYTDGTSQSASGPCRVEQGPSNPPPTSTPTPTITPTVVATTAP